MKTESEESRLYSSKYFILSFWEKTYFIKQ